MTLQQLKYAAAVARWGSFNEDGTVTEIQFGRTFVRACDHCLSDAGLCVKE